MTTSTTPLSLSHPNITPIGRGGRIGILVAGSALAVAFIGVAVQANDATVGGNSVANVQQPRSALLNGPALQTAIDASLATNAASRSALLNGPALQTAIENTLAADAE